MLAVLFLVTEPVKKEVYRSIDPFQKNIPMGFVTVFLLVVVMYINFSQAYQLKRRYGNRWQSNAHGWGGVLIFLSMFQYFLLLVGIPHYFDMGEELARTVYPILFFSVLLIMGYEMYIFYSKREAFKWLLQSERLTNSLYTFFVAFMCWYLWDIQIISGPKVHRTSPSDVFIVYFIMYMVTVASLKRYHKIENMQNTLTWKGRVINFITFVFSYMCMIYSSGLHF